MDMKTVAAALLAAAGVCAGAKSSATPSADDFHSVTNDWWNGNFTNVVELADARLAADADDLVGAHLKAEWAICFGGRGEITNEVSRMLRASDAVSAPAFTNEYGAVRSAWGYFLTDAVPALTDAQLADQHAKSAQPHRRMVMERILRVIDECGLWGAQGGEGGNGGE